MGRIFVLILNRTWSYHTYTDLRYISEDWINTWRLWLVLVLFTNIYFFTFFRNFKQKLNSFAAHKWQTWEYWVLKLAVEMFFASTYHEANTDDDWILTDDAQKWKSCSRCYLSRCPLASLVITQIQTTQIIDDCVFGDSVCVFFVFFFIKMLIAQCNSYKIMTPPASRSFTILFFSATWHQIPWKNSGRQPGWRSSQAGSLASFHLLSFSIRD